MLKLNAAQQVLIACGTDLHAVIMGPLHPSKSFSWRKKGPGRMHNSMAKKEVAEPEKRRAA